MAEEEPTASQPAKDDVVEKSPFPGDSKPDQGPSMGEHCTTDRPTPSGEVATGEITKLGDVEVYITKPNNYPHSPSKLLLFLTGGTGIKSQNNQIQADKYAAEGFLVVMPDQFEGDPAPNSTTDPVASVESEVSLIEKVKLGAAEAVAGAVKSFQIDMWLARHTPEKVMPLLHRVIDSVKEEFADAVASGGGIYAVGYCFGAKYVMLLASEGKADASSSGGKVAAEGEEQTPAKGSSRIKAGAVAHGTLITPEDMETIRAPLSLVCVENDSLFPQSVLDAGTRCLEKNQVDHEVHVYSGVPHGFAVLGDYDDRKIKESQSKAFAQMLGWLQSH
jgi:dienelactone hydrolase